MKPPLRISTLSANAEDNSYWVFAYRVKDGVVESIRFRKVSRFTWLAVLTAACRDPLLKIDATISLKRGLS